MYAWVKEKRVKSKKYPRVKIGKTLKKEYNIRFKIYPSPFTSPPQHIFQVFFIEDIFLSFGDILLSFGDIPLSFGDNFLSFGDNFVSFGDILLNDSMIFFALYFPNPRKSHKSHR